MGGTPASGDNHTIVGCSAEGFGGVLLAASVDGVLFAASVDGMLRAASVGLTLSPSAYVVVLLMSDFLAF